MMKWIFGAACVAASFVVGAAFFNQDALFPPAPTLISLEDNFNQTVFITAKNAQGAGSGSGVVVGPSTVLTACHVVVVNECGDPLDLTPMNNIKVTVMGQTFTGTVIKSDHYSDLSLLRLDVGAVPLTNIAFLSRDRLEISRESVYGIGHPYGLEKVIKAGLLAAETASLPGSVRDIIPFPDLGEDPPTINSIRYSNWFGMIWRERRYFNIFDINLLPGNSGGGIFDQRGHLIGIVSHIFKHPEPLQGMRNDISVMVEMGFTVVTKPQVIVDFLEGEQL